MFEWFKKYGIGQKLQAAVEDTVNGDAWAPFEGLEKGETLIRVTLAKGEYIRFEKYVPTIAVGTSHSTTIQLAPITNLIDKVEEVDRVEEGHPVKPRRKRT
jgi:hypothetical protein